MKKINIIIALLFYAALSYALEMKELQMLQKRYIRINPDLELYYVEAGNGNPILFIPGWIGTSSFFEKQITYFSKRYRAISYDPRSQGRSTKTLENNNYIQHGADLKAFMDSLNLKDVILVAHSSGCLDIYAYIRTFGIQNIKAIVLIDCPPKIVSEHKGDWGVIKSFSEMKSFYYGMSYDRLNATKAFLKNMFTKPLKEEELNWFTDELMKSPTYVALLLDYDGNMSDFTEEAKMIDGKIPVLNILADQPGWTEIGNAWLKKNTPHAEVTAFGLHFMLWEFADKFNATVDTFLAKYASK